MKKIYVYSGIGAYQAKDIENFLAVFDFEYQRICEHDFNKLKKLGILIIPGGQIKLYLPTWGKKRINLIKNFVKSGGIYIGICAGAYIAGKQFDNIAGLSFINQELTYQKHQSVLDTTDNNNQTHQLIAENGPDLSKIDGEIILKSVDGKPQLIKIDYGKGAVYLFASHPEGSVFYKKLPQNFSGAKFFNKFLRSL